MAIDKDVYAGAFFMLLGALGLWIGADYAAGTAARMGPGFLPKLLCWGLLILGSVIAVAGLVRAGDGSMERWRLRPLVAVLGSVLVFASLLDAAGLIAATVCMVLFAAVGSQETRWREAAIASAALAVSASLIFVKGLGMPMKILPGIL